MACIQTILRGLFLMASLFVSPSHRILQINGNNNLRLRKRSICHVYKHSYQRFRSQQPHITRTKPGNRATLKSLSTPPTRPLPSNLIDTALRAADAAGEILRSHFRQPIPVDFKSDQSPVTQADRLAEAAICDIIRKAFPDHTIIAEESSPDLNREVPGFAWVIDPLDGTRAFICGRPTFTTLIGVLRDGIPIVGVINQPITNERWLGVQGKQTTLNGRPVSVQARSPLSACIVQATTPEMFLGIDSVKFRKVTNVARNVVYGGDGYAYGLLSSGCGDVIFEADMRVWDFLPLVPVVEGAGGALVDWYGGTLELHSDGHVIATASPDVLNEMLEILEVTEEIGLYPGTIQVSSNPAVAANGLPDDPGEGHMESMTGFGRQIVERNGYVVNVQVKSVNTRFCEVQLRGAGFLSTFESQMVSIVKKIAVRGRITVIVDIQFPGRLNSRKLPIAVDEDAVREVSNLLKVVGKAAGVGEPSISDVLKFSEVFERSDNAKALDEILPIVKDAIIVATEDMCSSRRREGALLEEDIVKRTRKISNVLNEIEQRSKGRIDQEKARLTKILDAVVEREMSSARIEAEVTLFADRVDFTEELVRLRSHVRLFELTIIGSGEPIGQRLTFLLQEMNREANTLTVKASDAPVSHLVVLIKEEIEKIREQCSNIR